MQYVFIAVYLILVALLIYVAYSKHFAYYTLAKTAASLGFIAVAFAAYFYGGKNNPQYFYAVLPCLVLCLAGDVLLGLANNKGKLFSSYFIKGVIFFMLAHIGFCIVFSFLSPFKIYDLILPVILLCFTFWCSKSERFRLKRMKLPVMAYSLFVGLMCARGLQGGIALGNLRGIYIILGSVLFLLSDGVILLLYFHIKQRKLMRFANLFTYYIGLLFIALSCA